MMKSVGWAQASIMFLFIALVGCLEFASTYIPTLTQTAQATGVIDYRSTTARRGTYEYTVHFDLKGSSYTFSQRVRSNRFEPTNTVPIRYDPYHPSNASVPELNAD